VRLNTEKMRLERVKQHLSQAQVALMAGTSQNHYSYLESGKKLPGAKILFGISKVLDIPMEELLIKDEPQPSTQISSCRRRARGMKTKVSTAYSPWHE